ncbi:MAG: TonB-dependent receptor, partial [Runella slithyformis]
MDPKDSSLVTFRRSQSGGNFELKNLDRQSYILKITFVGLRPYSQLIQPTDGDLGEIKMQAIAKDLNEVVIRGERSPVTIKADTIEYNADSFKVQPNSVVEDLLKRLPGVEVARDGTVKAQGQEIRRVTVDGKEFFGRDPKLATKNLPADAVDKVQVFDRKSDQAQFTGIDDGQREKSINLTLKEDKKKGAFGSVNAGAGPDNRYSTRASINRFSKTKQLSFLGMGNNVNQQGFSISDYMNFSGGMQRMMAGGGLRIQINAGEDSPIPLNVGGRNNGFVRSWGGGLNYNNQINKKTDLQSNYFFNDLSQVIDREVNQETFLPNGSFKTQQNTNQTTQNTTHRANITLDHKIDSLNSLKWTNNVSYASNVAQTGNSSRSFNQNGLLTNDGTRQSFSKGNNWRVNSELLWRHKFHKKGRTLSTNFTLGMDQNDRNGTLNAINGFYGANQQQLRTDTLRQTNTQANSRLNYGLTASFTEPLGKRKFLELNYALQQSRNDVNRQVFDVNQESRMPRFNALLSNQFRNNFTYQRGGLNFRLAEKLYNFSAGLSLQQSKLEGDLILQKTQINRTFVNLLPNARFKYDFGSS